MKNTQKRNPMEILWICMSILCFIIGICRTIKFGINEGAIMLISSIICILMFLWRRSIRKNEEKNDGNN
ncbi:MAG: hypothetical protein MJ211_01085 [Bacteroidales bacterium]|nr:hypothetical protein [Bacteroidales bacterium]